ncbi:hypothetical protein CFP56_041475 [Quercus suber]|uniref:Uncharacterized protein n=1 Tax=Quercus suber TaxID=58331 RepID=A0AAW0LJ33_QUESU
MGQLALGGIAAISIWLYPFIHEASIFFQHNAPCILDCCRNTDADVSMSDSACSYIPCPFRLSRSLATLVNAIRLGMVLFQAQLEYHK